MPQLRQDLLGQVLRECLVVVIPGLLLGFAIAGACSSLMPVLLYRVSPTDPLSSVPAIASVLVLCLGCVAIPALRAAKVDPAITLREQ
jgi:ABC-type antimicrobial peptide transport system permease subunit